MTASAAVVLNWDSEDGKEFDETNYADLNEKAPVYERSKILAERKAWEMVNNPPEGKSLELVVLIPSMVLGKLLFETRVGSPYLGLALMTGKIPQCPHVYFPVVDVQDVARAHVLGITAPANERYILVDNTYRIVDIGIALSKEFRKFGYKCATTEMKHWVAKLVGFFIKDLKYFLRFWGKCNYMKNQKAKEVLGLGEFKGLDEIAKEMGWSFIELGMVQDRTQGK